MQPPPYNTISVAFLVLLGFIGFLFQMNLISLSSFDIHSKRSFSSLFRNDTILKDVKKVSSPLPTIIRKALKPIAECRENVSVASISGFAQLPSYIKDFLRYRHCREFPLLLDVPEKCGSPETSYEVFLLLVIKSSPGNYERREVIRKTWGQERTYEGVRIRRVFLTGVAASPQDAMKLNWLLKIETEEHRDILQWDFHDTFFNLTLKQVLFHAWMKARCPGVRFIFNGDDDVFANTDNFVHYLLSVPRAGDEHLFVGLVVTDTGPVRDKRSKYYVPVQVSASNTYPPYCGGGGILMSGYTSHVIYNKSLGIEFFPIDDVYLGMCLQKAGLVPSSHMGMYTWGMKVPPSKLGSFDPCYYKELLLVHRFVPYEMLVLWNAIHQPDLVCGKKIEVYKNL